MLKSTFTRQYDSLRSKLREVRKAAGLNQRELAMRLGREHSFVARIEQGERRVDLVEFCWICEACDADPGRVVAELLRSFAARGSPRKPRRHSGR
jgi:transcriptional regulator with XRE-family HTH domain